MESKTVSLHRMNPLSEAQAENVVIKETLSKAQAENVVIKKTLLAVRPNGSIIGTLKIDLNDCR